MKDAEKMEEKAIEVCPLCGSGLEKGYVASMMIAWSYRKLSDENAYRARIIGGGFWALNAEKIVGKGWDYPVVSVEAYRCKKCKLIIFRYGTQNPRAEKVT